MCPPAAGGVARPKPLPPQATPLHTSAHLPSLSRLVAEDELRQKAAAVSQQYGTQVGTSTANLLNPQEIRCVRVCCVKGGGLRGLLAPCRSCCATAWRAGCRKVLPAKARTALLVTEGGRTAEHSPSPGPGPYIKQYRWAHTACPCSDMVRRVQEEHGKLDILVNK